eukprot:5678112-Pyramimonas_sp.AAC.1
MDGIVITKLLPGILLVLPPLTQQPATRWCLRINNLLPLNPTTLGELLQHYQVVPSTPQPATRWCPRLNNLR